MLDMTDHTQNTPLTLVVGSTGKTGRRVVERLAERGVRMRLGSRSATPAFDWDDPATWEPVLDGVEIAYISYYPDLAVPGAVDTVGAFARQAVDQGVQRLVLLAGRGEEEAERCEDAVREAGADWTIVRCTWFAQNFSEAYMRDAVLDGVLALPVTDMREPFVDADDIADVAVAALTERGHTGKTYELTGPRLLTFADAVAEIAEASGREVRFQPISLDEFTSVLAATRRLAGRARAAHVPLHRGDGRPQREARRRRPAGARPRTARLPRVRTGRRRRGRVEWALGR